MNYTHLVAVAVIASVMPACGSSSGSSGGSDNVAGTWTAKALTLKYGPPGGTPTDTTTGQTIVVTESGSTIDFTFSNTDGTTGKCSGSLSGSTLTSSCSLTALAGITACTATFTRTDTIDSSASPMTMATSYTYTAGGGSACSFSGNVFTLSGTLTFGS